MVYESSVVTFMHLFSLWGDKRVIRKKKEDTIKNVNRSVQSEKLFFSPIDPSIELDNYKIVQQIIRLM